MKNCLLILSIGVLVGGCTMMPKYERPAAPVNNSWPNAAAINGPTNVSAADLDWRDFFDDPQLQNLIGRALVNNRDLRIAALRVEQSRAQYRIQRAELYPGIQGDASVVRQKTSSTIFDNNSTVTTGQAQTTYNVGVDAAYEVDLFGRIRSLKQEALERYFATDEARKSVQIALVSQVASEYLTLLQLQEAKRIAQQTLEAVQSSYNLNKRSFEAGAASELDLRTAEAQVQTAQVNMANYTQLVAQSENALVFLVGQPLPNELPSGKSWREQHLLADLPVGLPSEVLQRRPDILAAEHNLKAANADIGAARAAFFPRILLTGSAGTASAKLTDLFTGPSAVWSFSPQITVPIFDLGSTRAKLDVSKISKRIEIANYEKAIQTAFREVADALVVRSIIDQKLRAQELLLQAQQKRFDLTNARYRQGVDSYVAVLLAQQDLYAAQQDLLQFQATRLLNAITLYRSLGGGWKS
ncbi:MAG: cation/multidrug efflux system, outer rane channel TolC [Pedosphaera sp.]|nr:cation/multidrug efflux system, outer rane channel TolC [Pedosphaera sp.]